MQENEIMERIKSLCKARSWTIYRLAKESHIPYSTLFTMLSKANAPSIATLIKICDGFGITLAQFFDTEDTHAELTEEERAFLHRWNTLSADNRHALEKYMNYLLSDQSSTG